MTSVTFDILFTQLVFIHILSNQKQKYTQEYVSENINISTDLLRNIENGRNIGSIPTLLNICNFLKISPNYLFSELLTFKEDTLDSNLDTYIKQIPDKTKKVLKDIIIHIDKNY